MKTIKITTLLLVVLLALPMIGCKESSSVIITPAETDPDTTAPTVVSISPVDSADDVSVDTSVSVTFSEAMNIQSITTNSSGTTCSGSIQLSSNDFSSCAMMSGAPSAGGDNKIFSITPSSDLSEATTYKIKITTAVKDSAGNALASEYAPGNGFLTFTRRLPDTGQTADYTGTYGEDSDYLINAPSLMDNGNQTITDNNTKLMWDQNETTGDWAGAGTHCENSTLGNYEDWRLPNPRELKTIVHHDASDPAIDTTYFPNTVSSNYWSSTTYAGNSSNAWVLNFNLGRLQGADKSTTYNVRCVRRGGPSAIWPFDFSDINDEITRHGSTGLMWQKRDDNNSKTWATAIGYCEGLSLGGYEDWRLPNSNELQTIVNYANSDPPVDSTYFPDTETSPYWTSTTYKANTPWAWYVVFDDGAVEFNSKSNPFRVRCVRGGL